MPTTKYRHVAANVTAAHPVNCRHQNRPFHHTHLQQVAGCVLVDILGGTRC